MSKLSNVQLEKFGFGKFTNNGKICYMNSVLQALITNVPFSEKLLSLNIKDLDKNCPKNLLVFLLQQLVNVVWSGKFHDKKLDPIKLKNSIIKVFPQYSDMTIEYDAHELFFDILGIIHDITGSKTIIEHVKNNELSSHFASSCESYNNYFDNKDSIISNTFYGQFIKRFKCTGGCSNSFFNYDMFNGFTVFPRSEENTPISTLIDDVFCRDYVNYECIKCHPEGFIDKEHIIDQFIYKLPETLIITVNRFNSDGSRNNNPVTIEEELDLRLYHLSNSTTKYTFSSVICHLGSTIDHGHYATIAKKNNKIYIFDDDSIREMGEENKISQLNGIIPYVIFYSKL
jgi:ubiquitin C-terminal hydrolase